MQRFDGSLALKLDFGGPTTTTTTGAKTPKSRLRLAAVTTPRGPDKYRILEQRRRRAQIEARRLLDFQTE